MLNVYFNYPNSRATVHGQQGCSAVRQQRKVGQRIIRIDRASLSAELQRVKNREHRFASKAALNDAWFQIDLSDVELELAVAKHVLRQFSKSYKPFADTSLEMHC